MLNLPLKVLTLMECNSHCHGSLSVNVYHGRGRDIDPKSLADWDIVLSTYHTVAAEAFEAESLMDRISWFRIVLDEGKKNEVEIWNFNSNQSSTSHSPYDYQALSGGIKALCQISLVFNWHTRTK